MTEIAKIWKILPHKNALKPWFSWKIWWGSKKPLKFSRFLLLKKKFCLFGLKFENIVTQKRNKSLVAWFPVIFLLKFVILSKSKSNFQNFLPQSAWSLENFEKFQGNWSLFGNVLKNVPKKVKFYQLFAKIIRCTKKNLRRNLKSLLPFPILSIFAIFRPHST